jgi:hypothetical protein
MNVQPVARVGKNTVAYGLRALRFERHGDRVPVSEPWMLPNHGQTALTERGYRGRDRAHIRFCETNPPVNYRFCKDFGAWALGNGCALGLFLLLLRQHAFDAAVGDEPEEGDEDKEGVGDEGVDEGEGDGEEVAGGGEFPLPVIANGRGEEGAGALLLDDGALQNVIGDGGHEEDEAIDGGWYGREMVFVDKGGGEREKGEPEKQMEVRPKDAAGDTFSGLKKMMMVVPINADVDKTQDVAEEDGQDRFESGEVGSVRDFQLEHHDGDDDREDTVAEGFEPGGFHFAGAGCLKW